ncbi:MAG: hypothetical protein Q8S27_15485, partial [Hoeflea sp.]|nr:hypothetical protein [Hoeflea sp.]
SDDSGLMDRVFRPKGTRLSRKDTRKTRNPDSVWFTMNLTGPGKAIPASAIASPLGEEIRDGLAKAMIGAS